MIEYNVTKTEYVVPSGHAPTLFADYLKRELRFSSRLYKRIKYSGQVYVNGLRTEHAANHMLYAGDVVTWHLSYRKIAAENLPLDIRYEDDYLLIVNKPAGQLSHPLVKEPKGTLANAVAFYYESSGQNAAFHPTQRLDRQTSGLVVIAKSPQIHERLSRLGHDNFWREYLAICEGRLDPPTGTVDAPIARVPGSIIMRKVDPTGKRAVTHYRTLRFNGRHSVVALRLSTGRTHQIRAHMAHLGHPLAGDDLYGGRRDIFSRQALHAARVTLLHPIGGEKLRVFAPLPADMATFLR